MHKIFSLLFISITCFGTLQSTAQTNRFITDSLDAYITRGMQQWQIPGLSIAIVKDGEVVLMKGYGVKELGKEEKVDENTLFIIASNSKLFTNNCFCFSFPLSSYVGQTQ